MKNQYITANSNRQTTNSIYSNNQTVNKNQLASRLKVIEFLKDQLYPTGNKSLFIFFNLKYKFRLFNIIISISK